MSASSTSTDADQSRKKSTGGKGDTSLGSRFLSEELHERMQLGRWYISEFVRRAIIPDLEKGTRVLDAGSGRLPEQHLRDEILATGAELVTLDLFEGPGVDFAGDVAAMPFDSDSFDVVLCTQVLEHVPNPEKVCAELARVTRPGGIAVVTAPMSAYLHNLPYHFFHYTNIGLTRILEEAGFQVTTIEPQGGHFVNLAIQLHYTVRPFEAKMQNSGPITRLFLKGLLLIWRVLFGFLFKILAVKFDEWIPFEGNTQGWNAIARKPDGQNNSGGESDA